MYMAKETEGRSRILLLSQWLFPRNTKASSEGFVFYKQLFFTRDLLGVFLLAVLIFPGHLALVATTTSLPLRPRPHTPS